MQSGVLGHLGPERKKHGIDPATVADSIKRLEIEKKKIASDLADLDASPECITLHPTALKNYRESVEALDRELKRYNEGDTDELFAAIRALVSHVTVHGTPGQEGFELEIVGWLSELTKAPMFPTRSRRGRAVVAREGLEPPTPGL